MLEQLDAVLLARLQFAFTMSFHIVFPAFTIGLASYLAVLETLWLATGREVYRNLLKYWMRVFSIAFGMGVVSGIVMSYQFGTNWSAFTDVAGAVIGPLMAYEVMTAFFLEAGFLGVMLFGTDRVGKGLHAFATYAVAVGTLLSAFWILSVNSWMQTPQGHIVGADGRIAPGSWWEIVFNPSLPYRLVHMVLAAYLTTALVVGAAAAWHLLRRRAAEESRVMFSMAMWMLLLVAPVQILAGDQHGLNTLEHQPVKVMAMEGHFDSHPEGAPLYLFGLPNMRDARMDHAIAIPKLGSLILKHDPNAPMEGLESVPRDQWPPVPIVFWSFRLMVGIGVLMLAVGVWSGLARWRGRLHDWRGLHLAALAMGPAGFVAVLAGWVTTEVGRQPWVIYGMLRTVDAASPVAAPAVGASLAAFVVVYTLIFAAGTTYLLRLMARPPHGGEQGPAAGQPQHAAGIMPGGAAAATAGPELRR